MCVHRVDFTLTDSEDGSSLLLNLAVFKYELLLNFNLLQNGMYTVSQKTSHLYNLL